jgi:hypothetical protein
MDHWMLSGVGKRSNTLSHLYKYFMKYRECLEVMGIFLLFYHLNQIPKSHMQAIGIKFHNTSSSTFAIMQLSCDRYQNNIFFYKRYHDNLEIWAICKKSAHDSTVTSR